MTRSVGASYAAVTAPSDPVAPDSSIPVSATFTNDGDYTVQQAKPSLRTPKGWTVQATGPAAVTLAPGQSATENWTVGVPVGAQGTTADLTASLISGQAGRTVGSMSAETTVTVKPALAVSSSQALAGAGGSGTATLTVTSNLPGPANLSYDTSAPAGITVTPDNGTVTVPPQGASATVQVQAASGQSPGAYPVFLSLKFTDQGHTYALSPTQIPVAVPYASISAAYDNVGITDDSDTAPGNFPGDGASYSEQQLTALGLAPGATATLSGVPVTWPDVPAGEPDNVVASGQTVALSGQGTTLALLGAGDFGSASGTGTVIYTDGTTQSFSLTLADWYANQATPGTTVVATTSSWNGRTPPHAVSIYGATVPLEAGKTVAAVTLPDVSSSASNNVNAMHIFAMNVGG